MALVSTSIALLLISVCESTQPQVLGALTVYRAANESAFFYQSGLAIDADGAPNAYHPKDKGLDYLANAGKPGNWWGVLTADGKSSGTPVVQSARDPFPGYYISPTSLVDSTRKEKDPARYVNAAKVPYLALPPQLIDPNTPGTARLGDIAAVANLTTKTIAYAIVADVGPRDKLGEGSIALAQSLGVPANPKKGGAPDHIRYVVFAGSGNGKPRSLLEIDSEGRKLLAAIGGPARLLGCELVPKP